MQRLVMHMHTMPGAIGIPDADTGAHRTRVDAEDSHRTQTRDSVAAPPPSPCNPRLRPTAPRRSQERRVGTECVIQGVSRCPPAQYTQKMPHTHNTQYKSQDT